jgi:hypothetical protein
VLDVKGAFGAIHAEHARTKVFKLRRHRSTP